MEPRLTGPFPNYSTPIIVLLATHTLQCKTVSKLLFGRPPTSNEQHNSLHLHLLPAAPAASPTPTTPLLLFEAFRSLLSPVVRMPYTPPSQRSPAVSTPHSPNLSRRSSSEPGHQQSHAHSHSHSHSHPGHSGQSLSLPSRPDLPRSTSYLARHRRTPSVKSAAFAPNPIEPTPPASADNEKDGEKSLNASTSLRQSPPPVTDESQIPTGVVISPPDSTLNSSDDEDAKGHGRELVNEAELRAAIRTIEQHRDGSPTEDEINKSTQHLTLIMPSTTEDKPTTSHVEKALDQTIRKISHNRSNTDPTVFLDLQPSQAPETPLTGSDEESLSDGEDLYRSRRKPPMLRKKSGELVRPALRPSSAKRRPSSMPGTPTFGKAVHFDSHLEHVRHFLQVDRPLAVSANSSPVEAHDSDTEFPFGEGTTGRSPPFEWEIVVSNFPPETPARLSLPVRVERVFLSADNKALIGSVAVKNLAFNKHVVARFTLDYWKTTSEVVAEYNNDVRQPKFADGYDRFNFNIKLADQANLEAKTMFFCVKYSVNGQEYWDNNNSTNFQVDFRKKAKPQNGKKGTQGAGSRPAHSLPRSHKKSQASGRKSAAFDDFADSHFDSKYKLDDRKQPVHDFMGETGTPLRLKGVQSDINLGSDNFTRRAPQPNGQAFGNRYDFGASLSAAISAANSVMGDRSGITMKSAPKKQPVKFTTGPEDSISPRSSTSEQSSEQSSTKAPVNKAIASDQPSSSGTDSPRPAGTEKPQLASQSYNELLDKYCFFGSVKSSPQLKEGTLRPDQFDGSNDDGYVLGSTESTADSSPLMKEKTSPPRTQTASVRASRSTSPAPMTGFVTGTSSMYNNMDNGFTFRDTHTATAIRG
ncbi:Protein phosphatase 1 regulatory subunit 3B [Lachnellula occidentalis]|uniref:Protein phosphatase 1 regulatory subunit 3B n=1 Tax=Lachnellula occidentalis TaxID=215460 RepID=A0A8H8S4G9_9HELO|nr:Protein phosphatase 1 regulatory subunit 3B [Lachnellula occidentalis]